MTELDKIFEIKYTYLRAVVPIYLYISLGVIQLQNFQILNVLSHPFYLKAAIPSIIIRYIVLDKKRPEIWKI